MYNHDDKNPARPRFESGRLPPGYKSQSIGMSHQGRPVRSQTPSSVVLTASGPTLDRFTKLIKITNSFMIQTQGPEQRSMF